jgi:hypothetical protein
MKNRCLLLVALSASVAAHGMNLSLFGRLKSLSGHAATIASKCSSALSLAKEHKALAFGVAATAGVVTLAYKLRQMFKPKFWHDEDFFNAVAAKDLERARSLKAAGANVNVANQYKFGKTALHVAAELGDSDNVRFLLDADANTEVFDLFGWGPLHYAAKNGEPTVIQLLLKADAKKEVKDKFGCTPLHIAAAFGRRESVIALLIAGAKRDVVNKQGFTPLDLARGDRGLPVAGVEKVIFPEIVELLNQ